jgi:hypothetical protein
MGFFDWIFRKALPEAVPVKFKRLSSQMWSYCESDFGSADPMWCIRRLTTKGRTDRNHRRSRIDTPSLCGQLKPGFGWDLYSVVQEDQLFEKRCCLKCKRIFFDKMKRSSF